MSHCFNPIVAANSAVSVPMTTTVMQATGDVTNRALLRAMRYTPAVTIVAAWINADTGVGPSMASGSHVCRGNCALLAKAPMARREQIPVTSRPLDGNEPAEAKMPGMLSVPTLSTIRNAAMTRATSPMTWVMNALRAAMTALGRSYQKPMRR